jgi:hypothetical protein
MLAGLERGQGEGRAAVAAVVAVFPMPWLLCLCLCLDGRGRTGEGCVLRLARGGFGVGSGAFTSGALASDDFPTRSGEGNIC